VLPLSMLHPLDNLFLAYRSHMGPLRKTVFVPGLVGIVQKALEVVFGLLLNNKILLAVSGRR